jgi:hypothetical protein
MNQSLVIQSVYWLKYRMVNLAIPKCGSMINIHYD